ncbi:Hypothetical_protein [Hexamita inflata]|uniref:Hypothetical_protein n=1 Tax=Hexamita inflata TaxID=28002 RepID=A0AA86PD32_9EUKA|nr:Hypothetical protein HINF_LOCUS24499 [Hexamita inflata]
MFLRCGSAKSVAEGKIPRFKVLSCQGSAWLSTAPLLPQKRRWYDAGGFPYRSACMKQPRYAPGCLYPSRWLPWLRRCAQRTQVYLKLMIIRVNLQYPVQKTELVQTKVK